jgi:hypothetical protein
MWRDIYRRSIISADDVTRLNDVLILFSTRTEFQFFKSEKSLSTRGDLISELSWLWFC